jgi:hypothetical protein
LKDCASNLRTLAPCALAQVSRGLSDILQKGLGCEASHRYADAAELAADLRRHLTDQPLHGVRNRSLVALTVGVLSHWMAVVQLACKDTVAARESLQRTLAHDPQHPQAVKLWNNLFPRK